MTADLRAEALALCDQIEREYWNHGDVGVKPLREMARDLHARLAEPSAPLPEIGWMQGDPLTVEQLRWVREARALRARLASPSDRQVELEDCDHPCVRCGAEQAEPLCVDCLAEPTAEVAAEVEPSDEDVARAYQDIVQCTYASAVGAVRAVNAAREKARKT